MGTFCPSPRLTRTIQTKLSNRGAGNFFKAPKAVTAPAGVPTPITHTISNSTSATSKFHSGRGGAGNAHSSLERPVISFEDEYERKERTESTSRPAFTGRGGAGNFKSASSKQSRKGSDASTASNASTKSASSTRSGFLGRLSASLSNQQ